MTCGNKIGPFDCCSIVQGDSVELIKQIEPGQIQRVITDPVYGVGLGQGTNSHKHKGRSFIRKSYDSLEDTPDYVQSVCVPVIRDLIPKVLSVVLTPGNRCCFDYPKPDELGCIYNPAGSGICKWGFNNTQPILFYGKDPYPGFNGMSNAVQNSDVSEQNGHPCPKPLPLMEWFVSRASLVGEIVLDPFCGSGTTLVACAKLNRHHLGFDLSANYCEISRKALAKVYQQPVLFVATPEDNFLALPIKYRKR